MKSTLFILSILFTFSFGALAQPLPSTGYSVGDVATDFSLKNIDGEFVSLKDFDNVNGFIIIFTCNHCPYSVLYEDRIIALQDKFGDHYPVIAINPNDPDVQPGDSYEDMIVRAEEKKFNFPYLFDDGQEIFPQYGATRTPHVFLLDASRTVRYIGAIDDNAKSVEDVTQKYVEDAIAALESEGTPDPSFTKAIGCSIKVKK